MTNPPRAVGPITAITAITAIPSISARLPAMSAPFAIDPVTGRIRFPGLDLELRPRMPQAEFIAATSRLNRDDLGANDGWQRYSIREQIVGDCKFGLFVIFLNGKLNRAGFAYGPKDDSWDNWSEEKDAAQRRDYQRELDAQLGGKNVFFWGKASLILDSKSGGSNIWIDYSEAPSPAGTPFAAT
jgi:hypothetical protein